MKMKYIITIIVCLCHLTTAGLYTPPGMGNGQPCHGDMWYSPIRSQSRADLYSYRASTDATMINMINRNNRNNKNTKHNNNMMVDGTDGELQHRAEETTTQQQIHKEADEQNGSKANCGGGSGETLHEEKKSLERGSTILSVGKAQTLRNVHVIGDRTLGGRKGHSKVDTEYGEESGTRKEQHVTNT